jgi:hypothetical protein
MNIGKESLESVEEIICCMITVQIRSIIPRVYLLHTSVGSQKRISQIVEFSSAFWPLIISDASLNWVKAFPLETLLFFLFILGPLFSATLPEIP